MSEPLWLERKLGDWSVFAARHSGRLILITLLLTALATPFAIKAARHLDANLFNQVSDTLVRFHTLREASEDFGGDFLVGVLSLPEQPNERSVAELKQCGDLFVKELALVGTLPEDRASLNEKLKAEIKDGQPWLYQPECKRGQGMEAQLKNLGRERPHLFMSDQDVAAFRARFDPETLKQTMELARERLKALDSLSPERELLRHDPLGLSEIAGKSMREKMAGQQNLAGPDGYYVCEDQTTLLVISMSILPSNRLDFTTALMAAVQRAENRALKAFRATQPMLTVALKGETFAALAPNEQPGTLRTGFTGMGAVSIENQNSLKYDVLNNTITSFLGVMAIFVLMFKSFRLCWNVSWTTLCILIWTLAVVGLMRGRMSVLGGAFSCILLGIGTDYVTYLYNAFYECRWVENLKLEDALRKTMHRSSLSVLTAVLTTVLAFFGVCFTRFSGMAEFGLLAGLALTFYCAITLLLFPALLAREDQKRTTPLPRPNSLGMITWGSWLEHRSVQVGTVVCSFLLLAGALAVTLATKPAGEHLAGVRFDPELTNLRSTRVQAMNWRDRIVERFKFGLADVRVIVEAADEDTALAGLAEVSRRVNPWREGKQLKPGQNLLELFPSSVQQRATLEALSNFDWEKNLENTKAAISSRFGEKGLNFFAPFFEHYEELRSRLKEARVVTLKELKQGPLGGVLSAYVNLEPFENKPRVRMVSSWFPTKLDQSEKWYTKLTSAVEQQPPAGLQFRATSARLAGFELKTSLMKDFAWITVLVAGSVAACLLFAFRSIKKSLLSLIPIVFGYASLLGGVALCQRLNLDFSLNFVNLIMFPLLLGSGVDGGVYMVFDALGPARPRPARLMADTGRAVLCCILTTLVGFGSMLYSDYTGLISMGIAALYGYCGALFGALVALPALLSLFVKPPENKSAANSAAEPAASK